MGASTTAAAAVRRPYPAGGAVDVLVGGPPCQGHSDFNNRTRHADDKNELYGSMVRAAEVLEPQHILIENVPGALNDKRCRRAAHRRRARRARLSRLDRRDRPQRDRRPPAPPSAGPDGQPDAHRRRPPRSPPGTGANRATWRGRSRTSRMPETRRVSVDAVPVGARDPPAHRLPLRDTATSTCPTASARPATPAAATATRRSTGGWRGTARRRPSPPASTACAWAATCTRAERRTITAHEAARLQYIPDWFSFDACRTAPRWPG